MADTGAPFFLPYPEPTDLVRDGADAIKDLAEALAQALEDIPVTQKKIAAFTGDGTWTVPAGVTYAIAHVLGGGGGIGEEDSAGDGGFSRVAFGGSVGNVDSNGGTRGVSTSASSTPRIVNARAGQANSGRGAVAADNRTYGLMNANDAQYVVAGSPVTPAASITVTVGAGGAAGTSGAAGGSGYVYIEYYEEV